MAVMSSLAPAQLPLSIGIRDDARFANFHCGPNEHIVHALQQQWTTHGEPYLYVWGKSGVGCSHLLQAACHYAEGLGHHSIYLPLDELQHYGVETLDGMEQIPLVALDRIDAVAGHADWEQALFHLFNRIRDRQGHLLIAAQAAPNHIGVTLPDLCSRLSWGVVYGMTELDDVEKAKALQLRARRRGLDMTDEVARYVLTRGPREMQALFDLLERLDVASLSAQRKLTIPFVKSSMGW